MYQDIQQTLLTIIKEITGKIDISPSSEGTLSEAYGLDSMQAVALILGIEKKYGVVFGAQPEDMESFTTLDKLCQWVSERA